MDMLSRRGFLRRFTLALGGGGLASGLWSQTLMDPSGPRPDFRHPEGRHINLAGNENPFGPSPAAGVAIASNVGNSVRYPWREEVVLTEVTASYEGVDPERIVLTNGCDELLAIAGIIARDRGGNLLSSTPTYDWLGEYCEKHGGEVRWIMHRKDDMAHDLDGFKRATDQQTSMIYLCNPDTPSGTMLSKQVLQDYILSIPKDVIVFIDEVYLDLLDDFSQLTLTHLLLERKNLIIGRSFSKLYALAGHRVGYAVTSPSLAKEIQKYKTSSMNYLGVVAAQASLYDVNFRTFSRRKIREGRGRFCGLLDDLGLTYNPSVGNFIFHRTGIPIREYQEITKAAGFVVGRPFEPYDDWCRISVGSDQEMRSFSRFMRYTFA